MAARVGHTNAVGHTKTGDRKGRATKKAPARFWGPALTCLPTDPARLSARGRAGRPPPKDPVPFPVGAGLVPARVRLATGLGSADTATTGAAPTGARVGVAEGPWLQVRATTRVAPTGGAYGERRGSRTGQTFSSKVGWAAAVGWRPSRCIMPSTAAAPSKRKGTRGAFQAAATSGKRLRKADV